MVARPSDDTIDLDQTGEPLPDLVDRVTRSGRPVVIRRGGRVVAAVVPAAGLGALARDRERWEREELALRRISAAFADVDLAEIDRKVAEELAAVRAEDASR